MLSILLRKMVWHFSEICLNLHTMINIDRHIEILLLENDCVIVPGLGGFVAHFAEARYDISDRLFLPPFRTIGFNPVLRLNDSLLAQSYIEAYDVSYPEAMQRIEDEVDHINKVLDEEGSIELNGLGRLTKTDSSKILFEPYEGGLLTPQFYALNSYEIATITKAEEPVAIVETTIEEEPTKAKIISIDTNKQGEKRLSVSLKAIKEVSVAAAIIAFIFIAGFASQTQHGLNDQTVKSGMFANLFDSSEVSDSNTAFHPTPVQKVSNKTEAKSKHYWTIVLASHVTTNNANAFVKQLQKNGFTKAHVYVGSSSTKVLYGEYATAQKAVDHLNTLRSNANFKQAWVLEIGK